MKAKEFLAKKQEDITNPIYRVIGSDEYFLKKIQICFEDLVLSDTKDFNFVLLKELDNAETIVAHLNTPSFIKERKIIYVKNGALDFKEDAKKIFSRYLQNINDDAILVIEDERNSLNIFKDFEILIDASSLIKNELSDYIADEIKGQKYSIGDKAIKLLIEKTNSNLDRMMLEIQKLFSYCLDDKKITEDDVVECIGDDIEYNIFQLSNALADKKNDDAFQVLNKMLHRGMKEEYILSTIFSQYARLFNIKISKEKDEELAKILGIKPFAVKINKKIAKNYTPMGLKKIYEKLVEIELAQKTGQISAGNALQLAICFIMSTK